MRKILLSSLLLILPGITGFAQVPSGSRHIEIRLVSIILPDDSPVYVCGNLPELGNWDPGKIKMSRSDKNLWSFDFYTGAAFPIEYKFTLGTWEKEGGKADGTSLSNFILKAQKDTSVTDTVMHWLKRSPRKISGQVTGKVEYHRGLKGEGIASRDIIVWLPPDYYQSGSIRYPVLYMQDGQNLFDPATSSYGTDWQMDEICDTLIKRGKIKPLIVVGIYNTADRMFEYTPGEKGSAYMNFVIDTVKNFVDKHYRTIPGRKFTWVGGSSAGGTISFMLAWNHPEIFLKAFCLSPAFRIGNIDVVKDVTGYSGKKKKLTFYFDNGGKGLEERLQSGIDEMMKALTDKGYRQGMDFNWIKSPEAEHNEAAWAERMPAALKIMLGN